MSRRAGEKDERTEGNHVLDDRARSQANDEADKASGDEGDDGLVDGLYPSDLEVVRDPEGEDEQA